MERRVTLNLVIITIPAILTFPCDFHGVLFEYVFGLIIASSKLRKEMLNSTRLDQLPAQQTWGFPLYPEKVPGNLTATLALMPLPHCSALSGAV